MDMVKNDWCLPHTAHQNLTYIFLSSDLAWTWWKMIELHPKTEDQNITYIYF